jgi:DnaK suppressor protein
MAVSSSSIIPTDYDPKLDTGEFMNPIMLEYFRSKLLEWRAELVGESSQTIQSTLQKIELQQPDMTDRASAETDHALELRTRDRYRKLINKIDSAIQRINEGEYGYCEETGDPISIARLEARPIATLSVEAQERHERQEKVQRDD